MKQILFGTRNPGKLAMVRRSLCTLPLEIISLRDLDQEVLVHLPAIEETGSSALENARIKARAYYDALQIPVFSCDTGLYLKGLPEELQPGVHVRTINGRRLTDMEMTEYYMGLAQTYGDLTAQYRNAVCLILDENHSYESMDPGLSGEAFLLTSKPYPKRQEGFPLDCLSKDIKTGRYYYEMEDNQEDAAAFDVGMAQFFKNALSEAGWF